MVKSITGLNFPKQHTRRYIQRTSDDSASVVESENSNAKLPATSLFGPAPGADIDSAKVLDNANSNARWPATSLFGPGPEPDIDAIAELVFDDEAGCKKFFEIIKQEDAHQKLAADEDLFLDRGKLKAVVLGDVIVNHM